MNHTIKIATIATNISSIPKYLGHLSAMISGWELMPR
jgi:hypothetical protein